VLVLQRTALPAELLAARASKLAWRSPHGLSRSTVFGKASGVSKTPEVAK
jgi:hypothetical protein